MLNCKEITCLAGDAVNRTLSPRQKLAFKIHLMMCSNCRRFFRHFRLSLAYVEKLCLIEISADKAASITANTTKVMKNH